MAIVKLEFGKYVWDEASNCTYVKHPFPVWETTHEGRVLEVYNKDHRAMSDVYTYALFANVLDENNQVQAILVNVNFECDQSGGHAEVDATPEVRAEYDRQVKEANDRVEERRQMRLREIAEERAREPVIGKLMVVARGRKVPKGTKGIVAVVWHNGRVLLKDPMSNWRDKQTPGTWVDGRNLEHMTRYVSDGEGCCINCGNDSTVHESPWVDCDPFSLKKRA